MHPFENGLNYQTSRLNYALNQQVQYLQKMQRWIAESREVSNFTYDLEPNNINHLIGFVAEVTKSLLDVIEGYVREIVDNKRVERVVREITAKTELQFFGDAKAKAGRRIGWYAVVRATKPRVVIETGVDKGLGSCVLAEALRRNGEDGHPGRLYSIDINPNTGSLFKSSDYAQFGEFVVSDAIAFLQNFPDAIDLLISDADHSVDYEAQEFEVARGKLSPSGIILSDNAHGSDKLYKYCRKYDKRFLFFQERPLDHIYPGAGIGAAFSG